MESKCEISTFKLFRRARFYSFLNIRKPSVNNRQLAIDFLTINSKYKAKIIICLLLQGLPFLQRLNEKPRELRLVFLNVSSN